MVNFLFDFYLKGEEKEEFKNQIKTFKKEIERIIYLF